MVEAKKGLGSSAFSRELTVVTSSFMFGREFTIGSRTSKLATNGPRHTPPEGATHRVRPDLCSVLSTTRPLTARKMRSTKANPSLPCPPPPLCTPWETPVLSNPVFLENGVNEAHEVEMSFPAAT